jgi:hypothetical protein
MSAQGVYMSQGGAVGLLSDGDRSQTLGMIDLWNETWLPQTCPVPICGFQERCSPFAISNLPFLCPSGYSDSSISHWYLSGIYPR